MLAAAGAHPVRDAAGNVVARFGPADGPAAIVAAHLDTVFGPETELHPTRDGDVLRGPGIGDDALGLAAIVHLGRRLANGPEPAHPLVIAATVGEEGLGDLRGARALLDDVACDAFVAVEGHGLERVQVAGVAAIRLRARLRGPGGHSWGDRGAPSAVHVLLERAREAVAVAGDAHVNVGVIRGGTSVNTVAPEAEAEIDLRDLDSGALEATARRVAAALGADLPPGIELELAEVGRRPGGATPPDHPLLAAAREARRRVGLPPAEECASSTDANAALGRGIPAVCLSLTQGANAHRTDEHVELGPLPHGVAALDGLIDSLCSGIAYPIL